MPEKQLCPDPIDEMTVGEMTDEHICCFPGLTGLRDQFLELLATTEKKPGITAHTLKAMMKGDE
ncbi:hypothetical protein WA845_02975 [Agrobacterium sp. CMT1]|uniref:hypothetical protein n=1 Tax=Agrobacterium sp. CMT1 TaxID=3128901 RepID=UPI003077CFB3